MSKFKVGDIVETILNGKDVISSVVAEITDTPDVWDYPDNYYRLRVLNSDSSYFDKGLCFDSHEKHLKLKSLKDESHKKHMDLISDTHKQLNEIDLKPIESHKGLKRRILDELEFKQVLQTKPNNDFIYFKDQDMILPKKLFEQGQITIQKTVMQELSDETKFFTNGFSVLLGGLTLKKFETREQAQIFLKQLAEVLGSDIL